MQAIGNHRYRDGFPVTLHENVIGLPRTWKKPRRIFVNSMSDLFHPDVPLWFTQPVFETMEECPQHSFRVLTKRSDRVRKLIGVGFMVWVRALASLSSKFAFIVPYTYPMLTYLRNSGSAKGVIPPVNGHLWALGYFFFFTATGFALFVAKREKG